MTNKIKDQKLFTIIFALLFLALLGAYLIFFSDRKESTMGPASQPPVEPTPVEAPPFKGPVDQPHTTGPGGLPPTETQ